MVFRYCMASICEGDRPSDLDDLDSVVSTLLPLGARRLDESSVWRPEWAAPVDEWHALTWAVYCACICMHSLKNDDESTHAYLEYILQALIHTGRRSQSITYTKRIIVGKTPPVLLQQTWTERFPQTKWVIYFPMKFQRRIQNPFQAYYLHYLSSKLPPPYAVQDIQSSQPPWTMDHDSSVFNPPVPLWSFPHKLTNSSGSPEPWTWSDGAVIH